MYITVYHNHKIKLSSLTKQIIHYKFYEIKAEIKILSLKSHQSASSNRRFTIKIPGILLFSKESRKTSNREIKHLLNLDPWRSKNVRSINLFLLEKKEKKKKCRRIPPKKGDPLAIENHLGEPLNQPISLKKNIFLLRFSILCGGIALTRRIISSFPGQ